MKSVVCISLSKEWYCIEMKEVLEIQRLGNFTKVPNAPDFITGIINLSGKIVSVIDLHHFLGHPSGRTHEDSMVAIADFPKSPVGFLFDKAVGVYHVEDSEVLPTLQTIDPAMLKFTKGQIKIADNITSLISLKDIMSAEEINLLRS